MPQPPDKFRRVTDATKAMTRRQRKFLESLAATGQVTAAAKAAGVDSSLPYKWRKQDDAFREAWDALADQVGTVIESALVERVLNGVEKPLTYQGEIFGYTREYPDHVGVALLRGMKPDKYREAGGGINVNVNANNYGVALLPMAAPSEEEWEQQSRRLTEQQNKIAAQVIEGTAERVAEPVAIKRG